MKFIFYSLLFIFSSKLICAQVPAAKFDSWGIDSSTQKIYFGEVKGISIEKYDSLYKARYSTKFESRSLAKSPYKMEARIMCNGGFPIPWARHNCVCVYLDTIIKIKFFDDSYYNYKESLPKHRLNADSIYDKLIENGIFSLTSIDNAADSNYRVLILTKNKLLERKFEEMKIDDGWGCTIEYKVENIYNIISFGNPGLDYRSYPDNQILRRQYEIAKLVKNLE